MGRLDVSEMPQEDMGRGSLLHCPRLHLHLGFSLPTGFPCPSGLPGVRGLCQRLHAPSARQREAFPFLYPLVPLIL